jgi:hypothetical protein
MRQFVSGTRPIETADFIVCREGEGPENGRYDNGETALMFPIVSLQQTHSMQ